MKKTTVAIAAVTATLSLGTAGIASAATTTTKAHKVTVTTVSQNKGVNPIASVLASLVANGTITAAQSTAISNALAAARPTAPTPSTSGAPSIGKGGPGFAGGRPGFGGFAGGFAQQDQSVILSTLGITEATLKADQQAGKSLATIAGAQTQALITALVAAQTTAINAQVTAGKLTQAQATTVISGLTARVTAEVNATPGKGFGGRGAWAPAGTAPTTTSGTASN